MFFRREIEGKALVSETEAKEYFARNADRIRTELHVWQILHRGEEGSLKQALKDIDNGTFFEEVAKRQFPKLPAGQQPWDLGYLRWHQVPEPWLKAVSDLKKGEVSGIIRGPNKRFWIIKLVDKRENPDIDFESVKLILIDALKNAKVQELRERLERDPRRKARVVYPAGEPSDVIPSVPGSGSE